MSEDLFSVLAALSLIALLYRYFSSSSNSHNPSNPSSSSSRLNPLQRRAATLPRAQIDRLLGMFPQCTEEEIRYALVTVRGGVEAVAERVLMRGVLEPPPRGFFPQQSRPLASSNAPTSSPSSSTSAASKPSTAIGVSTHITRLNLGAAKAAQDAAAEKGGIWTYQGSVGNDSGVVEDVRERKERMVLEARWALMQKQRKGKGVSAA